MSTTLVAVIAHSPIGVRLRARRLPGGFGEVDVAILDWIVAEARTSARLVPNVRQM